MLIVVILHVVVVARARSDFVRRELRRFLSSYCVSDISRALLRVVLARAWVCSSLLRINEWLQSQNVFWSVLDLGLDLVSTRPGT